MKTNTVFLSLVACFGVTACGAGQASARGGDPAEKRDAAWVSKRALAWQPTKEERAFDEIGWASDLREAQRLAKEHRRPVFLFTYDGASLAGYRC